MEDDILELQEEIDILKKRIASLEAKDNRRRAANYVKILIKGLLIAGILFGIWYGYNYVVHEIPNIIEQTVKDKIPILR